MSTFKAVGQKRRLSKSMIDAILQETQEDKSVTRSGQGSEAPEHEKQK